MKVLTLITSSNRNGFTKQIVDRLSIGIQDNDGTNEVLFMNDYDIKYCTGCRACEKGEGCILEDDFEEIIDKIRQSDYFIFTAPIFWNDLAGHSKMFLDRLNSIGYNPDLGMNEKLSCLILTHYSKNINSFVIENTHRCLVSGTFKVNKILDIGNLMENRKLEEFGYIDSEGNVIKEYIVPSVETVHEILSR